MPFDPYQPFEVLSDAPESAAGFDPSQPFELVEQSTARNTANAATRGATAEGIYSGLEGGAQLLANARRTILTPFAKYEEFSQRGTDTQETRRARSDRFERKVSELGQAVPALQQAEAAGAWYADAVAGTRRDLREALPVDEAFQQSLFGQIVQGVGQAAGTLPTFAIPGAGAGMAVGQLYDQAYQDALEHGADAATAHSAGLANVPAAALEYAGDKLILGRILKPLKGKLTIRKFLSGVAANAASEGATEGAQTAWQNVVASSLAGYDPDRQLDDQVINSILVGAAVGGGVSGLGQAGSAGLRQRSPRPASRVEADAPAAGGFDPSQPFEVLPEPSTANRSPSTDSAAAFLDAAAQADALAATELSDQSAVRTPQSAIDLPASPPLAPAADAGPAAAPVVAALPPEALARPELVEGAAIEVDQNQGSFGFARRALPQNQILSADAFFDAVVAGTPAVITTEGRVIAGWDHGNARERAEERGLDVGNTDQLGARAGWVIEGKFIRASELDDGSAYANYSTSSQSALRSPQSSSGFARRPLPPDTRVTVQQPFEFMGVRVPGWTQIDFFEGGQNTRSAMPEQLTAEGYELPAVTSELPTAQWLAADLSRWRPGLPVPQAIAAGFATRPAQLEVLRDGLPKMQARWRQNFEQLAPGLARDYRLQFGDPQQMVELGLAEASQLTGYEQAAYAARERMLFLFDAALQANLDDTTLINLQHEMAHVHFDDLPETLQERLAKQWQQEVRTKTGPLYKEGKLRGGVAFGTETDLREWYAESTAWANHHWAKRRLAGEPGTPQPSNWLREAAQLFRDMLAKIASWLRSIGRLPPTWADNTAAFRQWLDQGPRWEPAPNPQSAVRPPQSIAFPDAVPARTSEFARRAGPGLADGEGTGIVWADSAGHANVPLAHLDKVRIVEMPELVQLVREGMGAVPEVRKLGKQAGDFQAKGTGRIRLDYRLFKDSIEASKVMAHEIGHWIDYLPDGSLKRGNILGRLATLRNFLKGEFNGVAAKEVRSELIALTDYWRPYQSLAAAGKVKDSYVQYRESSVELYADAISVLFNSPATLKERAPLFWEGFWNYIDRKPEVKQALFEVQQVLNQPGNVVRAARNARIQAMFAKGDEIFLRKAAEREARYASLLGWMDRIRQDYDDVFHPLVSRARKLKAQGVKLKQAQDPDILFEEHPLADNRNYRMLQKLWGDVIGPMEQESFTTHDLGQVLLLNRIVREAYTGAAGQPIGRANLANPLGLTPASARRQLLHLRYTLGKLPGAQAGAPLRYDRLQDYAERFHEIVWKSIEEAVAFGSYSQQVFDNVISPNRGNYAAFGVLDYLEDFVSAGVREQRGTLKDVANPLSTTVLKMVSLNRLNQLQKAKIGAVGFMQQHFPAEIRAAETFFDGRGQKAKRNPDPDGGELELLVDGGPTTYWVPKDVAQMFEGVTPSRIDSVIEPLNLAFRKLFYPLFIQYNPSFQLALSPVRDMRRSFVNLPRAKGLKVAGEYLRNYASLFTGAPLTENAATARDYLAGRPNPVLTEMLANSAIGLPYDSFASGFYSPKDATWAKMMERFHLAPAAEQQGIFTSQWWKPLRSLFERIEWAGLTMETLPKVSTYRILREELNWSPAESAAFVRNNVGVPNFRKIGRHTRIAGTIFPFFNVFLKGYQADFRLATGAKSRSGWWLRWAAGSGGFRVLAAAGAAGLLGAALKELYDGISEYDKTNYLCVPIGRTSDGDFGGKTVFLRLPEDEVSRLLGGIVHKAITGAAGETRGSMAQLFAFGTEQTPSLNPLIKISKSWNEYLAGQNPMDGSRNVPILSNSEYLAGGWPSVQGMAAWTYEQTGVQNFFRYDTRANNWMEIGVSAVPGINRMLKVSDYGHLEQQRDAERGEAEESAKIRVAMPERARRLYGEYQSMRSLDKERLTPAQAKRRRNLATWYNQVYKPSEETIRATKEAGYPVDQLHRDLDTLSEAFERE